MNKKMTYKEVCKVASFIFSIYCLLHATPLLAANLTLTATTDPESLVLDLEIDKVDKLAGMKLSIDYPAQFLNVKTAQKAAAFKSFMQVVNDKIPGRIIMVMASATGVSGEKLKIFEVTFSKAKQNLPPSLKITPTECQLMSESLQSLPCSISPLSVSNQ